MLLGDVFDESTQGLLKIFIFIVALIGESGINLINENNPFVAGYIPYHCIYYVFSDLFIR